MTDPRDFKPGDIAYLSSIGLWLVLGHSAKGYYLRICGPSGIPRVHPYETIERGPFFVAEHSEPITRLYHPDDWKRRIAQLQNIRAKHRELNPA